MITKAFWLNIKILGIIKNSRNNYGQIYKKITMVGCLIFNHHLCGYLLPPSRLPLIMYILSLIWWNMYQYIRMNCVYMYKHYRNNWGLASRFQKIEKLNIYIMAIRITRSTKKLMISTIDTFRSILYSYIGIWWILDTNKIGYDWITMVTGSIFP